MVALVSEIMAKYVEGCSLLVFIFPSVESPKVGFDSFVDVWAFQVS